MLMLPICSKQTLTGRTNDIITCYTTLFENSRNSFTSPPPKPKPRGLLLSNLEKQQQSPPLPSAFVSHPQAMILMV